MKKILIFLYIAVIVSMAVATIVEKDHGTTYVAEHYYGAWWFTALWALLVAFGVAWMVHQRMRKPSAVLLHLSFVMILAGALLTHLTSRQGIIHLRLGETTSRYLSTEGNSNQVKDLPFSIRLDNFSISYHEGTGAAADYLSHFTIDSGDEKATGMVSMNNIYSHNGIRLYQSSYDDDQRGSYLSMNSDPWGIPVTYVGYALLFVALVWILFDPKGAYRQLLRSPQFRKQTTAVLLLLLCTNTTARTDDKPLPPTLPQASAERFGQLYMNYNDRICPVQTFALDFTKKLCGKRSYRGLTAEQVLTGFIFWSNEWDAEPIVKVKSGELRQTKNLPKFCSVNQFFSQESGYILGPMVQESYQGNNDKLHQEAMKVDDRLQLIMQLRQGLLLRLFPAPVKEGTANAVKWFAPSDKLPAEMEPGRKEYIQNIFGIMNEAVHQNDQARLNEALVKMLRYQKTFGATSIPSATKTKAEHYYNAVPFATILFMVNLTLGFPLLFYFMWLMTGSHDKRHRVVKLSVVLMVLSCLALTVCLALRWIVSGTIPMSNGYETMLLMAWFIMLLSLFTYRYFPIILCFGFLMSGFFLLVSHISQMDPQITHLMPVLSSPLLTIHVSIIMMAFALLALTFICGLTALGIALFRKNPKKSDAKQTTDGPTPSADPITDLALLSRLFLYPALTCLGFGIFTGAIWANVSWGTYWSWDPKETWALITFMVYAVAVHDRSLPFLRRPVAYHAYVALAFLTILMTYFGVNYVLGGMHSYA